MRNKTARRWTTVCLSGALALSAAGQAQAAPNDAALKALFDQPTTGMKNPMTTWRWSR